MSVYDCENTPMRPSREDVGRVAGLEAFKGLVMAVLVE
jgi:hypothetical protein